MPAPTEVTNVVIEKGMSFSLEFDISNDDGTDYSLSGFTTASATIRKHAKSTIKEEKEKLLKLMVLQLQKLKYKLRLLLKQVKQVQMN